jgi:hypothetical protein
MALILEKVRKLGDFVDQVRTIRADWTVPEDKELWFRGEKRDYRDTRLRPILYRPPQNRSLKPIADLLKIQDCLFEAFQRYKSQLTDTPIEDDFEGYLLMQHHGGPTRLLDWSDGSLMALHFALRNSPENEMDSVVYVLEPSRLTHTLDAHPDTALREQKWSEHVKSDSENAQYDSAEFYVPSSDGGARDFELPRIPMLLQFPLFSRRVAAQRSRFIVFGTDPSWLSDEFQKTDSSICSITIDARSTKQIRAELRECGVTESVIFPDLEGLGRELRQLWEDRQ